MITSKYAYALEMLTINSREILTHVHGPNFSIEKCVMKQ